MVKQTTTRILIFVCAFILLTSVGGYFSDILEDTKHIETHIEVNPFLILASIDTSQYTPRSPIEISNDAELEAEAIDGNGTAAGPYILVCNHRNYLEA